jgi:hypothetical protein
MTVRIGLLALYLAVIVGISVATHLCGGVPVSTGLLSHPVSEPDDCCGPDEQEDGCCATVITTVLLDDDHLLTAEWSPVFTVLGPVPASAVVRIPDVRLVRHDPAAWPPQDGPPLHLLHATLLI